MSQKVKKPVKNMRDIFEATDQPYNTVDYRNKLCDCWISYQQDQAASLHEPTDLESLAPNATQKSRPPPSPKNQQFTEMHKKNSNEQRMKKRKHDNIYASKLNGYDTRPQFEIDNADEPFFEFDMSSSANSKNNKNHTNNSNNKHNDGLASKTQNRGVKQSDPKQKYVNNTVGVGGYGGKNTMNMHTMSKPDHHHNRHHNHRHQSQGHAKNAHPSSKRQKLPDQHFDIADNLVDFQFDFDVVGRTEKHQQQQHAKKKNEDTNRMDMIERRQLQSNNADKVLPNDPFAIDFGSFANTFDDNDKNNKQPTPQFIYKRFKERSYAELMGTTPTWQKADNKLQKRDATRWENSDELLFKQPPPPSLRAAKTAAVAVATGQNAVEKFDWYDERDNREHHKQRAKKRHSDPQQQQQQQYVISHEIEKFVPKTTGGNNGFHVIKATGHSQTLTSSTQPNIFYIKCNNLILKHD